MRKSTILPGLLLAVFIQCSIFIFSAHNFAFSAVSIENINDETDYFFEYSRNGVQPLHGNYPSPVTAVNAVIENNILSIELTFSALVCFYNEFLEPSEIPGGRLTSGPFSSFYRRFIISLPDNLTHHTSFSTRCARSFNFKFEVFSYSDFIIRFHYYPVEVVPNDRDRIAVRPTILSLSFKHNPGVRSVVATTTAPIRTEVPLPPPLHTDANQEQAGGGAPEELFAELRTMNREISELEIELAALQRNVNRDSDLQLFNELIVSKKAEINQIQTRYNIMKYNPALITDPAFPPLAVEMDKRLQDIQSRVNQIDGLIMGFTRKDSTESETTTDTAGGSSGNLKFILLAIVALIAGVFMYLKNIRSKKQMIDKIRQEQLRAIEQQKAALKQQSGMNDMNKNIPGGGGNNIIT